MLKVLIFESDAAFAGMLQSELRARGAAVTVVDDASAGLQAAASEPPDLILLAIELPRMNGFSVCNKLKRIENLKDVPLIIMSSDATDETFEQHQRLRTRAEDYAHKPISWSDLEARISAFVSLGGDASEASEDNDVVLVEDEIDFDESDLEPMSGSDEPPISRALGNDEEVNLETERAFSILVHDAPPAETPSPEPPTVSAETVAHPPVIEPAAVRSNVPAVPDSQTGSRRKADEIQKLQRALDEARSKAGSTARDFLELREQLNRKDKEILDLRDQLSNRDKELLALRDANLSQERDKTDLNDKMLELERQIHELERANKAAKADKEQASKRADESKKKAERLGTELDAANQELKGIRDAHAGEIATLQSELAAAIEKHTLEVEAQAAKEAALSTEYQQLLEAVRTEAATLLNETSERLKAEKDAALTALEGEATQAKAEAIAERERQLGEEHKNDILTLERAAEEATALLKSHHQTAIGELSEALSSLRQRHDSAQAKWNDERSALERLKQTLQTALDQLAEAQHRPFE
jgi:CheY-like chemotaxis protein